MEPHFDQNPFSAPNTTELPVVPESREMMEPLAERGTRFAGSLIDTLLYVAAMVPGFLGVVSLGITKQEGEEFSLSAMGLILIPAMMLAIYQWYLVATTGQSLSKKWLKMKIVKNDGAPVDFLSGVVLRVWVIAGLGMVPIIGNFVGIVDAVMIFGDDRLCLHDRIAGTKVIDVSNQPD